MSVPMKPLFIPLISEYYEQFANGTKTTELRKNGPRWNGDTCVVGRSVILSKGYGKQNRLSGRIYAFIVIPARELRLHEQKAVEAVYGYAALDLDIALISIDQIKPLLPTVGAL